MTNTKKAIVLKDVEAWTAETELALTLLHKGDIIEVTADGKGVRIWQPETLRGLYLAPEQAVIAISIRELAKRAGICYQTAWWWIRLGKFPGAVKVPAPGGGQGGQWLIPGTELEQEDN